jgi:DNA topoisomerase-1
LLAPHICPPRPDGTDPRLCPVCGTGRLSLKLGKFGAFIGCSNYPECRNTRPFSVPGADGAEETSTKVLGIDPESGLEVTLRSGRFGPYVQLGEAVNGEKPKRAGVPRGTDPGAVDLDMALKLLSLPREVGRHPEDGEPIMAGIGRFGPYVQHGKTYANVEAGDDVLHIGLNRAVTLIAEKIANPKGRRRFGSDPGRALGDHPDKGGLVVVKSGRYGPYVSHDGINATLPKDKAPETITLEEALPLLAARAEQIANGGGRRPPTRRGKAAKSAAKAAPPDKPAKEKVAKPAAIKPAAAKPAKTSAGKPAKPVKPMAKTPRPTAKKPAKQPAKKLAAPKPPAKRAEGRK